jgi:tetratricopeptide (TPR) repeat protein
MALLLAAVAGCAPSPQELWEDAEAAVRSGDPATASIHLKNLLALEPDNGAARVALGTAALALGDPVSAEKEFRRAVALGGDTAQARLLLVDALLAQGRFTEALAELGPHEGSVHPQVLVRAGRAYEGLGQFPEAEARFREAMAASPGDPALVLATAALSFAAGRREEADALLERALLLDPGYVPALVMRSRRLFDTRGPAAAEAFLREALPEARTLAEEAEVLVSLAEVQLVRGDLPGARQSADRLEAISPNAIPVRYLRARVLAQSGEHAAAISALQRILRDAPDFMPAERLLGAVHYLNANLEQAAVHLARVIARQPDDAFMVRLLAELRLQQNRPEQALQTLLPMIRQSPGAAFEQGMLALAGQASLRLGDTQAALSYFRRGSEQYPEDEAFRLGEISARLASGDTATARTMLEGLRASSSNPLAIDYLSVVAYLAERDTARAGRLAERLAAENADQPWAHLLLATVYAVAGRGSEARREFDAVLRLDSGNPEALINLARLDYRDGDERSGEQRLLRVIEAHPDDYRARMLLAAAQLEAGRFNAALEQARLAMRLTPDSVTTLNLLGRAAAAAGRWDEARESFGRITVLTPQDARAWLNLARATVASGRAGDLPESMHKALEIAPRDPAVLVTAGDLLMELGEPAQASGYFATAYKIAAGADIAIRACRARLAVDGADSCDLLEDWLTHHPADISVRLFKGYVHQSRGERAQAIAAYERVLRTDPNQVVALNNLAWLYFETGDPRARDTAERALRIQPESASVMDTLGWIETRQGERPRGLELLAAAARRARDDPEIQYHYAFALAESGDSAAARQALAPVLAATTSFASRAAAEELMQRLDSAAGSPGG